MDTTTLLIKMVSALAIVTGLLIVLFYFLKKINLGRTGGGSEAMQVISVLPILPKRHLAMVKVRDKVLVLGITEEHITLLYSDDAEKAGSEFDLVLDNIRSDGGVKKVSEDGVDRE